MYIDPGCGNPKPATLDPRDRTPAPRSRSPSSSKKRKSRVPERRSRSPELNMRPMLGRFKNRKNRKNFGVQKSVRQLRFRQGFERFSGPGPNVRKIGEKKHNPRKRSHGQQHKPWEPCACFPDYGRGQALTPSNELYTCFGPDDFEKFFAVVAAIVIISLFRRDTNQIPLLLEGVNACPRP